MTIQELFDGAGVIPARIEGAADVTTMTMDSRRAKPGAMFVCMPSSNTDSNAYIPAAASLGAGSVLTFSRSGYSAARELGLSAALLGADMYQDSLWKLCKVAFGNPSASMKVIGVTGTNGKTTTAWLIRDMLKAMGLKAAYLGTLGFQLPGEERELQNTTPFAIELNELLAEARDKGVEAIAMEVSSHALAERRVDGIEFDAAVFTNLTQDHLDFHGSMEAYEAAKLRLFTELPMQSTKEFIGAFNMDAPGNYERFLKVNDQIETILYGVDGEGWELMGKPVEIAVDRILIELFDMDLHLFDAKQQPLDFAPKPDDEWLEVQVSLGGAYNVENIMSAIAAMEALGFTIRDLISAGAFESVRPVPGRFEAVPNKAGIGILVDYAHTPDALEKLLDAVRPLTKGRIITVFGCGGDRDRTKRPKMAKAASERSDLTVVTSDNPRTEDPVAIVDEVASGIVGDVDWSHVLGRDAQDTHGRDARATVIIDRREAVAYAIGIAKPGDVVVIAGKGHENYQIIGRTKHPMDDRELAREGLAAVAKG